MILRCPHCHTKVNLGDRICPNDRCLLPLDVCSVLKRVWHWITLVRCTECGFATPLFFKTCSRCDEPFTVQGGINQFWERPKQFWERLKRMRDDATKRKFQRSYFWASVALFLPVLWAFDKFQSDKWVATVLLSLVFCPC